MPRREPKPAPDLAFDFLADWHPLVQVDAPLAVTEGWVLHGTITKHGNTYALAWGGGMVAACDQFGHIVPLTALERSRVKLAVENREQPGWESVPKPPPSADGFPFRR